jgi:hypothetical protein
VGGCAENESGKRKRGRGRVTVITVVTVVVTVVIEMTTVVHIRRFSSLVENASQVFH